MHIIDKATYKLPKGVTKILLIQMGDIGDVVWMTPTIWAVKNSIPGLKVSVLVKEGITGIPTTTIYGPSNWKDWAPVGKDHRVWIASPGVKRDVSTRDRAGV